MGELHLEIIVDRMKREFGVEANVGKPQVAYRETIRKTVADVEGKFVRQSGGKGQYGHVVLKIEPQEPGKGFEFVDAIKGGVVPREYIPAVEKGVEDSLPNGVLAGYPVVDVKVTLHFGSYHDVDSNENAFKMAAIVRLQGRLPQGQPGDPGADDGRGSRDAGRLRRQRDGRPVVTPRHGAGHGRHASAAARSSRPKCRCRKCSATRPRCARCRKAAPRTRWSSSTTAKLRTTWPTRSSRRAASKSNADSCEPVFFGLRSCAAVARGEANQQRGGDLKQHTGTALYLEIENGKRQIRADQAARERGHDWSRGPWQDHADGGDHDGAGEPSSAAKPRRTTRSTRRRKKRRAASRSTPRTSSTRPPTATTRTSTAPATPTT